MIYLPEHFVLFTIISFSRPSRTIIHCLFIYKSDTHLNFHSTASTTFIGIIFHPSAFCLLFTLSSRALELELRNCHWVAISVMAFHRAVIFLLLLYCTALLANAARHRVRSPNKDHFFRRFEANVTFNGSLWASYYRNISAGGAWLITRGASSLEPRAIDCQCFNPDGRISPRSSRPSWRVFNEITDICDRSLLYGKVESHRSLLHSETLDLLF